MLLLKSLNYAPLLGSTRKKMCITITTFNKLTRLLSVSYRQIATCTLVPQRLYMNRLSGYVNYNIIILGSGTLQSLDYPACPR